MSSVFEVRILDQVEGSTTVAKKLFATEELAEAEAAKHTFYGQPNARVAELSVEDE